MITLDLREKLNHIDNRTLYLNLVLTQVILCIVGIVLYILFLKKNISISELYHIEELGLNVIVGLGFAALVILIDVVVMRLFPKDYFDDGGVNERIFRDVHVGHIFLIAIFVATVEEWLFRGVIQNLIGVIWTSILFAAIHFRYFRKWFYATLITLISFGFGYLYEWTNSLWSVTLAHFFIDFSLGLMIRYNWLSLSEDK